jgi:hypothetical protein
MSKIKLEREWQFGLMPYAPKPGEPMCNTLEISVYRDHSRKAIVFRAMLVNIERHDGYTCKGFMVFGPTVRLMVAQSPTHAPKKFAKEADAVAASIESRSGYWWSECQSYLDNLGVQLAESASPLKFDAMVWALAKVPN